MPRGLVLMLLTADVDINKNGMVERNEFGNFIFRLAVADLKHMEDDDI
jgi:hypothetical protein